MSFRSDICFIIYGNVESAVFADSLKATYESIASQEGYDPQKISVAVTADAGTEELQKLVEGGTPYNSAVAFGAAGLEELRDLVSESKYLFFVENGDILEKGALRILEKHARNERYSIVYLTNREWVKKRKSEFMSCTFQETETKMSVRSALIRREAIGDLKALLGHDQDAAVELGKTIIGARGFYMDYKGILTYGPVDEPVFTPDAEKMRGLMDYAEETFPGGMMYVELYILMLISMNLEMNPDMGDVSDSLLLVRDETILTLPGFNIHKRLHFLKLKYGRDIMEDAVVNDDGAVFWHGERLFSVSARNRFRINILNIKNDEIYISGTTDLNLLGPDYHIVCIEDTGNRIPVELVPDPVRDQVWPNGEIIHEGKQFELTLPLRFGGDFEFILEDKNERQIVLIPGMSRFSRMAGWPRGAYFVKDGYMLKTDYGRFTVEKNTAWKHFKAECEFNRRLLISHRQRVILYRILHYICHIFQRKPVWIVADRPHVAGDNGEHMFRFLMKSDSARNHEIRFLIRKDSKDYERMKAIGPVLEYGSLKHRMKFMETSLVIAAAANDLATSAFGNSQEFYRDLCDYEFVYLRHGVAKDDQSRFLNKQRKNIRVLVSTSKREHDAIVAGKYGYTEREVKLTGLPRFDNLYDQRQNKITILPTWRKNLEGTRIQGSSEREYIFDFKDTDYYKFYNSLINDKRLLDKMRELHFTGSFYLHPVFEEQFNDFKGNDVFEIGTTVADYQTLFRESSIMVTDFSSVAFDFAYLKKPLIYSQFDEATFYQDHSWDRGYFSYHEDGFGPITNTVEETVDALINYMDHGCQMEEMYVKRVEAFFPFTDRNNCQRVYEAILEAEKDR